MYIPLLALYTKVMFRVLTCFCECDDVHTIDATFFVCLLRTNTLKLEGVCKLWGKEGYLPKKESKLGKENEPQTVSCGSLLGGQMDDPPVSQSDEVSSLSEEDKEKQQLASTLFTGLGSNAGVSLVSGSF